MLIRVLRYKAVVTAAPSGVVSLAMRLWPVAQLHDGFFVQLCGFLACALRGPTAPGVAIALSEAKFFADLAAHTLRQAGTLSHTTPEKVYWAVNTRFKCNSKTLSSIPTFIAQTQLTLLSFTFSILLPYYYRCPLP